MARRTKEEAAVTREQLLDAAERVFRERGVAGSTLARGGGGGRRDARRGVLAFSRQGRSLRGDVRARDAAARDAVRRRGGRRARRPARHAAHARRSRRCTHLARDPRSQAVFEVMFQRAAHGRDGAARRARSSASAGIASRRSRACCEQAVEQGQLPADTDTALATQALHAYIGGIMHSGCSNPRRSTSRRRRRR